MLDLNYEDIWQDICYKVKKSMHKSERDFQNEIVNIFGLLGWSERKGEIKTELPIQMGTSAKRADIVIFQNNKIQFIIELKKANSQIQQNYVGQLKSYMRQLRVDYGILIAEKLQLFYVKDRDEKCIEEIEFDENNIAGIELFTLLSKFNFRVTELDNYCEKRVQAQIEEAKIQQEINNFCTLDGKNSVIQIIRKELSKTYSKNSEVDRIIENLDIEIKRKSQTGPLLKEMFQTKYDEKELNKIKPNEAISICQKNGLNITENNNFASLDKSGRYYGINPNYTNLNSDWWLMLNDWKLKQLHVFKIPKNSISKNDLVPRSDKMYMINLLIMNGQDFEDKTGHSKYGQGIYFKKYLAKTIRY